MQDLYYRLLKFTGDGAYRYSFKDGRIIAANEGFVRILDLGCTPEEVVGRFLKDILIYVETAGSVRELLELTGEIHGFEYHFRTLKGDDRWVIHDSFLVTNPDTGEMVVEAIVKDITLRKKAEQEIAAERERLRVTLRSIGDGVIATGADGRIQEFNQVAEDLTGWSHAEAVGKPLTEVFRIINEQTRQPSDNPVAKVLRLGIVVGLANHTALISRDGTVRSIADSGAPIRDGSGQIVGVVLVFRDVTEQRRAAMELDLHRHHLEEMVQERTHELETTNERLNREIEERKRTEDRLQETMENLARSNTELEQFAYVASHDLQEPLRKIQAFGDRLRAVCEAQLTDQGKDYLARTLNAAARMSGLINDLLTFSRVTTQGRPFEMVDLNQIAGAALSDLEVRVEQTHGRVEVGPLPAIESDPTQMGQLFQNLIGNALKFHKAGVPPIVRVSGETFQSPTGQPFCRISVCDNGIGFDEKYLDRIFVIFQQLHARGEYEGTGIGLAICRKIAERHRGAINATSKPGEGATFVVTLPVRRDLKGAKDAASHQHSDGGR